jgi:hypothetical protein
MLLIQAVDDRDSLSSSLLAINVLRKGALLVPPLKSFPSAFYVDINKIIK